MASTAKPAAPTVAVFIGLHPSLADAIGQGVDVTVSASPSPTYPRKHGTPEEWREIVTAIREQSDDAESGVIAEAMSHVTRDAKRVTVYCATLSLGVRAPADSATMWEQYPTIAAPDAWQQFGSLARTLGATITFV